MEKSFGGKALGDYGQQGGLGNPNESCPNCGYCRHCGRGGQDGLRDGSHIGSPLHGIPQRIDGQQGSSKAQNGNA